MLNRALVPCALLAACSFEVQGSSSVGGDGGGDPDAPVAIDAPVDPTCADLWTYTPSNFDPCAQGAPNPVVTLSGATFTFSPATGVLATGPTTGPTTVTTLTTTGTSPVILSLAGLTIEPTARLEILGTVPVIISVHGPAVIDGAIVASARLAQPGPGGGDCVAMEGASPSTAPRWGAGGGGAGGAFGTVGAGGGFGDTDPGFPKTAGGTPMAAQGSAQLVPLRGGCRGGSGGQEDPRCQSGSTPGAGGGGGGAIQISVRDALTLGDTAAIAANGGGGGRAANVLPIVGGYHVGAGGGGGGSGGAILIEGPSVTIAANAILCANGGGGGAGSHQAESTEDGLDATCTSIAALAGLGSNPGGNGGVGTTPPGAGDNGQRQDDGGGGGGGGVGRIRVRVTTGARPQGFRSTPPALID